MEPKRGKIANLQETFHFIHRIARKFGVNSDFCHNLLPTSNKILRPVTGRLLINPGLLNCLNFKVMDKHLLSSGGIFFMVNLFRRDVTITCVHLGLENV